MIHDLQEEILTHLEPINTTPFNAIGKLSYYLSRPRLAHAKIKSEGFLYKILPFLKKCKQSPLYRPKALSNIILLAPSSNGKDPDAPTPDTDSEARLTYIGPAQEQWSKVYIPIESTIVHGLLNGFVKSLRTKFRNLGDFEKSQMDEQDLLQFQRAPRLSGLPSSDYL